MVGEINAMSIIFKMDRVNVDYSKLLQRKVNAVGVKKHSEHRLVEHRV